MKERIFRVGHMGPTLTASDIDAVLICTPEFAHVAPALAALQAGKAVMIEKPLATSLVASAAGSSWEAASPLGC